MSSLRFLLMFIGLSLVIFSGCYYDSEEDLYPDTGCDTTNVSFANDIQPILVNSCLSCHSAEANQGNIDLEGHAAVLNFALDGSLVGSVQHSSQYSAMPQGASKLDECKIAKLDAWVKAGAPNN